MPAGVGGRDKRKSWNKEVWRRSVICWRWESERKGKLPQMFYRAGDVTEDWICWNEGKGEDLPLAYLLP